MNINELNEDHIGKVLGWMAQNEERFCIAKADLEAAKVLAKRVRATVYLATDGTAGERTAEVEAHDDVQAADDAVNTARLAFDKLDMAYDRGRLQIDIWRTLSASRRAGMVL
jgi:hypothetical protein